MAPLNLNEANRNMVTWAVLFFTSYMRYARKKHYSPHVIAVGPFPGGVASRLTGWPFSVPASSVSLGFCKNWNQTLTRGTFRVHVYDKFSTC